MGEISRNIYKNLYEHKRDISLNNLNNTLFRHIEKTDHDLISMQLRC